MLYPTGSGPCSVISGDFNKDNKLDLAVANFLGDSVSVLLGNGDGTFQTQMTYPTGEHPNSVISGDFNKDNKLDLAVANFFGRQRQCVAGQWRWNISNSDVVSNWFSTTVCDIR